MLEKAEAIRCLRVTSLINEKFDFLDHDKMRGDFLAYFKKMCRKKYEKWDTVYRHFYNYVDSHCTFGDLTVELCKGFGEYLLSAHQLRLTHRKVRRNSAAGYYSTFRGLLKVAYRDKLIRENINDFLDKIETEDVKKSYLTLDELRRLAATPCHIEVLKQASLFSCLTGLRISDVLNLKWEDFEIAPDQGYCIRIRTQKTQTEAILPISYEAIKLCGKRSTGTVFKGLTRSMTNYPLKKWIAEAGITKPITFHTARHTFATMMLTLGADLYTVSKLLGHSDVKVTQVYAKIVNQKKNDAVNLVNSVFG